MVTTPSSAGVFFALSEIARAPVWVCALGAVLCSWLLWSMARIVLARRARAALRAPAGTSRGATSAFRAEFAKLAAECLSHPTTHNDRFRTFAQKLDESTLPAVAEHAFAVQQEVIPDLIDALCAKHKLPLVYERRPTPKDPERILGKRRKEDGLRDAGKESQFLKVIQDLAAARFMSEDLTVLRRAYDAALAFFEKRGHPLFKSDETPNELSLRFIVEVDGAAIEVQFLHPAANFMFSQNSAAGYNCNRELGETPNFFNMPGVPKPFYDALSDAVINRAADASLPALLTRTYTSKRWTEAAIPPELMRYAEIYSRTNIDKFVSSTECRDEFAKLAAECLSHPTTHDDRFRTFAQKLDEFTLPAVAEHAFAVQQEVIPDLMNALRAKHKLPLKCERRPMPKDPKRILEKMRKEDGLRDEGKKSQFLKVIQDLAAARFMSEDLTVLRRAYDAALAFFEKRGDPLFKSGQTPNELSLRFIVEVRGAAIEVQFLHPAAKVMFSRNSAAGHNCNREPGETPNFFNMPGVPKPFYEALSDAVINRAADASLPALLTRTYKSKRWTEAAIPPELMQYAERYSVETRVSAHVFSASPAAIWAAVMAIVAAFFKDQLLQLAAAALYNHAQRGASGSREAVEAKAELPAREDEPWDMLPVLDLLLHDVRRLDVEKNRLARERLDDDEHTVGLVTAAARALEALAHEFTKAETKAARAWEARAREVAEAVANATRTLEVRAHEVAEAEIATRAWVTRALLVAVVIVIVIVVAWWIPSKRQEVEAVDNAATAETETAMASRTRLAAQEGGGSLGRLTIRRVERRQFRTVLPDEIDQAVVDSVIAGTHARQTNEASKHGAVFVLVPPGTPLNAVGYHLADDNMTRGFVSMHVRFSNDDIDAKLKSLLSFDGATVVDGTTGEILAICFAIEPPPNAKPRKWRMPDGHGTGHNSSVRASEVGPFVVVKRSQDGPITVFTPKATASGHAFLLVE